MTVQEFESWVNNLRCRKGWVLTLECRGVWLVTVHDKETGEKLGETGSTSLMGVKQYIDTVPIELWERPLPDGMIFAHEERESK